MKEVYIYIYKKKISSSYNYLHKKKKLKYTLKNKLENKFLSITNMTFQIICKQTLNI